MFLEKRKIESWGLKVSSEAFLSTPSSKNDFIKILDHAKNKNLSISFLGHACSHADSCQNKDNILVSTSKLNRIISFDISNGIIKVEPGVSISKILSIIIPHNWFMSCVPGSLDVTIGGAVAFDVHGKDSMHKGSFCDHVIDITIIDGLGSEKHLSTRSNKKDLNFILGGMGLFGLITEITIKLQKIPSFYLDVNKIPSSSISESIDILEDKSSYDFAIGWIDTFSKDQDVGRGFVKTASWNSSPINDNEDDVKEIKNGLKMKDNFYGIDIKKVWPLIKPFYNNYNVSIINYMHYMATKYYFKYSHKKTLFSSFLYIHNLFPKINYLYTPGGLTTCQPILPKSIGNREFEKFFQFCQKNETVSMMAGLKRRVANNRELSFALDGYSFSIDLITRKYSQSYLRKKMDYLYDYIIDLGGIVYLAKDDMLRKSHFMKMYPGWKSFMKLKTKYDPYNLFQNDQFKRLFL